MRKLFRMQYEPCNGQCYADRDVMPLIHLNVNQSLEVMALLTKIHEPACGNANVRYTIDLDETLGIYVAVFFHYGKMEMFVEEFLIKVVRKLANAVQAHVGSPAWQEELQAGGALGHGVCHHGDDEGLRRFMVDHSGLPPEVQKKLLAA